MTVEYVQDYLNRYIGCKQASDEFCSLSGGCKNCEYNRDTINSEKVLQMMIVIRNALERENAAGCEKCVYQVFKDNGIPCIMCKRNSRDYWEEKR